MITIRATIGDTIEYTIAITKADGTPYVLSSCMVWFTAKINPGQSDQDAAIRAYWIDQGAYDGLSVVNQLNGTMTLKVPPAVTALLEPATYLIDLQLRDPDGDIYTVDTGKLIMSHGITQRTTTP